MQEYFHTTKNKVWREIKTPYGSKIVKTLNPSNPALQLNCSWNERNLRYPAGGIQGMPSAIM